MGSEEKTFTSEQVSRAVNDGADLVLHSLVGNNERDSDLLGLAVNAIMELLDHPEGVELDEVIERNYEVTPAELRGWWVSWS